METQEKKSNLAISMGLTEMESLRVFDLCIELLMESESVSSVLQKLVTNFDLTTKEVVIGSYYVGMLNQMKSEELSEIVYVHEAMKVINKLKDKFDEK